MSMRLSLTIATLEALAPHAGNRSEVYTTGAANLRNCEQAIEILRAQGLQHLVEHQQTYLAEQLATLVPAAESDARNEAKIAYTQSPAYLSDVKAYAAAVGASYWEDHGQVRLYVGGTKADYVQVAGFQGYSSGASMRGIQSNPTRVQTIRAGLDAMIRSAQDKAITLWTT